MFFYYTKDTCLEFYNETTYYARNKLISQSDQSIGLSNNKRMQSEDTQPGTKNGCAVWSLPMSPILLWDEIQWIVIFVPGVVRGSLRFLITYYYYQNVLLTTLIDSTPVRFVYIPHHRKSLAYPFLLVQDRRRIWRSRWCTARTFRTVLALIIRRAAVRAISRLTFVAMNVSK